MREDVGSRRREQEKKKKLRKRVLETRNLKLNGTKQGTDERQARSGARIRKTCITVLTMETSSGSLQFDTQFPVGNELFAERSCSWPPVPSFPSSFFFWLPIPEYRRTTLLFVVLKLLEVVESLACYSCVALNYRQNVLSRNDALSPPQSRENLSALFDALSENNVSHVEVSSSCADVTLTSQPSFLNTPIAICGRNDKCVKMDFYYSGEKIVLRNCLSNLMEASDSPRFRHHCPMYSEDRSEIIVGRFKNVSVCSCQSDLCNVSDPPTLRLFFLLALIALNF